MALLKQPRERALFFFLVSVLGLLALFIGGKRLLERKAFVQSQLFRLHSENLELRSWIAEKPFILSRKSWLDEHLQPSGNLRKSGLEFLETVEKQAQSAGVKITEKSILDPESNSQSTAIPLRISIQCGFHELVVFLHAIQEPGDFVMLEEISIKANSDAREVVSDLELLKFFQPETLAKTLP